MNTTSASPFRFKNLIVLMLLTSIGIYMSLPHIMRTPDGRVYPDGGCSMMHQE
jgi:hypothetical protein